MYYTLYHVKEVGKKNMHLERILKKNIANIVLNINIYSIWHNPIMVQYTSNDFLE
jgi:hypothetical protein